MMYIKWLVHDKLSIEVGHCSEVMWGFGGGRGELCINLERIRMAPVLAQRGGDINVNFIPSTQI